MSQLSRFQNLAFPTLSLLWLLAAFPASAQNITGTVFRDVDANGALDASSPAESGVGSITVTVYDAAGAVVGSTTTASDGSYTVAGGSPSEQVRVEFTSLPAYLLAGPGGTDSETTVTFVTMPGSGDASGVDLGVANPSQHCLDDPNLVTNCYIQGDQSGTDDVLVSFPYTASGNTPAPGHEAAENQIGTTWGLAYQRSSDSVFAGSFQKRHAGYGDGSADGTGAIYRIVDPDDNTTAGVSTFLNLNTLFGTPVAGTNPHPTGSDFDIDAASYGAVGKVSFGDLDISEDELTLWAVNLADRRLYEIPLGTDPANPVAPTLSSQVDRHDLFDLYDCDGDGSDDTAADVDIRPFALKVHDSLVYVGLVCTGESTADNADLRALVFSFDPADGTFTNVLDFGPLTYARGVALSGSGCPGTYQANWNYWQDAYPGGTTVICVIGGGVNEIAYPMPWLADIEFAVDGTMLLGLRDRFGDMQGFNIEDPDGPAGDLHTGDGYGDLLRATPGGPGWVVSAVEATDGTEFFGDDDWTDTDYVHEETSSGGLALRPGNEEILYTRMDPLDGTTAGENDFSAGVRWKSTTTGSTTAEYEIYDPDTAGTPAVFGKGNGLGDLELLCDVPPLQVGNRLWIDLDRDGIQDAGEPPLGGIVVQLIDTDGTTVLDSATTAADGTYFFSNGTGTSTASSRFGISALTANSALGGNPFTLRIDLSQASLSGYFPTFADTDPTANGDARDSDGNQSGSDVEISFDTGVSGANLHAFDFGFIPVDATCGDLDLATTVSPIGTVGPGDTVTYSMTVTNNSASVAQTDLEVWSSSPPGATYVPQSTVVNGFRCSDDLEVVDEFAVSSFGNNDGPDNWAGPWIEVDGAGLGPGVGNAQIVGGNLSLDDAPSTTPAPSLARQVDLSGYSSATFRFAFQTTGGVDASDAITVEASSNGGGTFAPLEVITGITGVSSGVRTYSLTPFISASTQIRFRVSNLYGGGNEFFQVSRTEITARVGAHFRDEFTVVSFANNDGNTAWAGAWIENDVAGVGPGAGNVTVAGGFLNLDDTPDTATEPSAARQVDLSGACSAILRFDFQTSAGVDASDAVTVEVSSNGGTTFTPLEVITGITGASAQQRTFDISNFIAANTQIRFRVSNLYDAGGESFAIRDVEITTDPLAPATLDNVPGGGNDLVLGDPSQLVVPSDQLVLPPGTAMTVTFQVTVDDPLTTHRLIAGGTVQSSESPSCSDFAQNDVIGAALGDLVWLDTDADAVFDVGEIGIPNVTVTLFADDDGTPGPSAGDSNLGTTLTDSNGVYLFDGLGAGTYYTQVTGGVPAGLSLTTPGATNPASVVTLGVGEIDLDSDFPYTNSTPGSAVIGDYVWSDADNDGVQDPGEPGIGGVTLQLLSAGPDGVFGTGDEVVEDTVVTTADGRYLFTNVSPGEYVVDSDTAGVLGSYNLTTGPQSNPDPTLPITVAADDIYLKADFGYFQAGLGKIGNQLWLDANNDGTYQAGSETGIDAVTIDLILDSDGDGTQDPGELVVATTTTGLPTELPVFRVTEYLVLATDFSTTTFDLTLDQDLEPNYFAIVQGSDGNGTGGSDRGPDENYAAVSADPFGTGELALSSGADIVSLVRGNSVNGWQGVVTVVECLRDCTTNGFVLRDVRRVDHAGATTSGAEATSSPWFSLAQTMLIGGFNGSGCNTSQAASANTKGCHARIFPSNPDQINWTRNGGGATLTAATSTVMVVEWGSEWTVQRQRVQGGNGGPGADDASEYNTAAITAVDRANTWVWGTGHTNDQGIGDAAEGVLITLGDGATQNASESQLAVGLEVAGNAVDFEVYALSHDLLLTDQVFKIDGDTPALTVDVAVDAAGSARMALATNGQNGTGNAYPRPMFSARYTDATTVRLERRRSGQAFPAWVQGIDFSDITVLEAAPGQYQFCGLLLDDGGGDTDADYLVVVTDTNSALDDLIKTTGPAAGADDNSQLIPYALALSGGSTSNQTADFGYNSVGRLGDLVWADSDSNGIKNADELGIPGVSLDLYFDRDGDGVFEPGGDDGAAIDSTTTDTFGNYLFDGLAPGTWFVTIDDSQPALSGYSQTTVDDETAPGDQQQESLTTPGDSNLDADFGYVNAAFADIAGNVFNNRDLDGCDDGIAEEGIEGVSLDLIDVAGNVLATTTTDSLGDYAFVDLPAATYTIRVSDSAGILDDYVLTSGRDELDVVIAASDVTVDAFGYARVDQTGAILGTVWLDADPPGAGVPDGLRGPNEVGVTMVYLSLYRDVDGDGVAEPGGDDGAALATTVVDAAGNFGFESLAAGNYFVDLDSTTLPASLVAATGTTDPSSVIALSDGKRFVAADFGFRPSASTAIVGSRLWYDANSDGLQDPGESGIGGITINYRGAGTDTLFSTPDDTTGSTTTAGDGTYSFTGLAADNYLIGFDPASLPAGLNSAPTNTGLDPVYGILLAVGDVVTHLDWGFDGGSFGTIGDFVWLDLDGDGTVDAGETGLDSVTTNLIRDVDGDGAWDPDGADDIAGNSDDEKILGTCSTASGGSYTYLGLPLSDDGDGDAGDADYLLSVTDLGGVLGGLDKTLGTPGVDDNSQDDPYAVELNGATSDLTADFGFAPATCSGSLGTIIWHDLDMDGFRDPGEPPIEGVTVAVWFDVDGNGSIDPGVDNLLRTVATDFNGEYELKGLPFGDYLVDVTDTAGMLTGLTKTTGTPGTDDHSQADPYPVTLTSGSPHDITADFGYRDDPINNDLEISGTVFIDVDIDALLDFTDGDADLVYDPALSPDPQETASETLVQGASLLLFRIVDGAKLLIGRTTTDVFGFYRFRDLPQGDYEIDIDTTATAVDGFLQTTQAATGGVQQLILDDTSDADWTQPNTNDSRNNNFGFFDGGITYTPVTLSFFEATGGPDWVRVEWKTATETGHIGFHILVERPGAGWQRLSTEIIPSSGADSISVQSYEFESNDLDGAHRFMVEDLDIFGRSNFHGPFELGRANGRRDLSNTPIDWPSIRSEHFAKQATRSIALKSGGTSEAKILVDTAGVYRISYGDLAAAGLDLLGVPAATIAVFEHGDAIPIRMASGPNFGPGSFLELVGRGLDTLYTKTNVYVVRVDADQALRVLDDATPPPAEPPADWYLERAVTENDNLYGAASPTSDPWIDSQILAPFAPTKSFDFEMPQRVLGVDQISMQVDLWGGTDWTAAPDHHVVIDINGLVVADETFDGIVGHQMNFAIPESALFDGVNVMTITLPGDTGVDFDLVNLDRFAITYPRAFEAREGYLELDSSAATLEVGNLPSSEIAVYRHLDDSHWVELTNLVVSGSPGDHSVRFAGTGTTDARFVVASGPALAAPTVEPGQPEIDISSGRADFLILSHPDFIDGLAPLVDIRRSEGWDVAVVDVSDVYAQFGNYLFDPQALQSYIAFAHQHRNTRAVLLVGGDTYDYHDYLGHGGVSFIPSIYAATGEFVRYAPSDGLLADIDDDEVPDLAIGRFPVRTSDELDSLIERTLQYEDLTFRESIVLVADDYDAGSAFDFTQASEQLASYVPNHWQTDRVYLDLTEVADARNALLELLDAGPAMVSFEGHSGRTTWTFEDLFEAGDAENLDNHHRPMLITQWGCWTTYYVSPENETLAHKFLLSGDRGAAAVLGATTLTEARSERTLSLEIYQRLFDSEMTVGQAVLEAKQALAAAEDVALLDVLVGWNLLGDPTLTVTAPSGSSALIFADGFESGDTSAW